jgi:predicted AlkP superfamily phosphohydrolase/phosphomutase/tetratricopeptide (TPR) repeat protein
MSKKKLLLVGWDAADWKIIHSLMDRGLLAGVRRLVEGGVSGNLTTLDPALSPMLWTSVATGKMAYHHGVTGFTEVDPVDKAVVPVSAATRKCRTLWEMLGDHGYRSHVVNWFATQGEQDLNGKMVSNLYCHLKDVDPASDPTSWPKPPPGTYWPPELEEILNEERVSIHDLDPDEVLRPFVPEAHRVDQSKDQRLKHLAEHLAQAFSAHNAAVRLMEMDPDWDFFAVYYRTMDEISHEFMHYHPPRMEGISEEDFDLYHRVIDQTYCLHDAMLQRLIQLAGPDTAVVLVSDHGYHSDHLRPKFTPRVPAGITVWHRQHGVFAASGAGIKQDELVFGARLLDVAPTILHYFGLPVGEDMEGRALTEVFSENQPVATIPSWEREDRPAQARLNLSEGGRQQLLEQFVALGYIDELPDDREAAARSTQRENDWNLARAYTYSGYHEEALPLLERCFHDVPHRVDFAQALSRCQNELGLSAEAEVTIDRARERFRASPRSDLIKANIVIERKDHAQALELLTRVREAEPENSDVNLSAARCYAALHQWQQAREIIDRVMVKDPENPQAHLLLTRVHLAQKNHDEAVRTALTSIGLQYGNPRGHFLLGIALTSSNRLAEAAQAFRNCLTLVPDHLPAMRMLARTALQLGQQDKSDGYQLRYRLTANRVREERRGRLARVRQAAEERQALRDQELAALQAEQARVEAEINAIEPQEILVVSGLPRSGTSLMMQILKAGGIDPMTDGARQADDDNPEGYWEWEDIKKLPKNPRLIDQTVGKAVKVITALLPHLPRPHRYKIIYMVRPTAQVVASQQSMLERNGRSPSAETSHLIALQDRLSQQVRQAIASSDRADALEVSYPELMENPDKVFEQLAQFLPGRFRSSPSVFACIKPDLFRHREP